MTQSIFTQCIINGLMLAGIYILVALGLTLVYSILHVLNFAHGEVYMLGGYVCYYFFERLGLNYYLTVIAAILILGLFGAVIEKVFFRRLRGELLPSLIISMGFILILQVSAGYLFGAEEKSIGSPFPGLTMVLGTQLATERIVVMLSCGILLSGLFSFVRWNKVGQAMLAIAQDPEAAALQGINVDRVSNIGFSLSCALAGAAGVLIAPILYLSPWMGSSVIIKAFIIIILGGIGSVVGVLVGGLLIGLLESFLSTLIGSWASNMAGFAIIILILLIRPRGLGHA